MTSPPEFSFVGAKIRLLAKILLKLLSSFREFECSVRSNKEGCLLTQTIGARV